MSGGSSFDGFVRRLRAGDAEAESEVFRRFAKRLVALAASRFDARLRQKEDPEDVIQSVFRSFFSLCGHTDERVEFRDWDGLWSLLCTIALRKCDNRFDHYHAARRNVTQEVTMACDDEEARESRGPWDAVAEDPTPSQAAMLGETLEQLMRGFNDVERTIISLRLQEFTVPEIGVRVQRSDRTVRRVLERARLCLQRLEEGEDRR